MKKRAIAFVTIVLMLCLYLTGCNESRTNELTDSDTSVEVIEKENKKETKYEETKPASNATTNEETKTVESNTTNKENNKVEASKETVREYTIESSEGVEIISFDSSTGSLRYKAVCSYCGNVDSTTKNTYVGGGSSTLNSSYNCNKCQEKTDIKVKSKEKVTFQ